MKLVVITYVYPPYFAPRSIQIGRLMGHLGIPTTVYCTDDPKQNDDTLLPPVRPNQLVVFRAKRRAWEPWVEKLFYLIHKDLVYLPDRFRLWSHEIGKRVEKQENLDEAGTVLVTFGNPMSCHLAGLALKKKTNVPWVAHFSDPWVDNPYSNWGRLARQNAKYFESEVVSKADRIVFTSQETLDLVTKKYPTSVRNKSRVLFHCFESSIQSNKNPSEEGGKKTIRYLGDFYGKRTPEPLFRAIEILLEEKPELLEGVSFELIGSTPKKMLTGSSIFNQLPAYLLKCIPSVSYQKAIDLMNCASALLVIDAPIEPSPFFPSKLADYLGVARPILGFCPPGAAATVIKEIGGWIADPRDAEAGAEELSKLLTYLGEPSATLEWGDKKAKEKYNVDFVARQFEGILKEIV